ncbi:MAG: endonuclease MutS2 [Eubacteriales bacterium]|nr:endonuclease MutS2 [Eubacteriales bacterium]
MNQKTLNILEFHKVRAWLADECHSIMGQEKALALTPSVNPLDVAAWQAETLEGVDYVTHAGGAPQHGFSDIRTEINKVRIGATLQCAELLKVSAVLRTARTLREALLKGDTQAGQTMQELAGQLVVLRNVENDIERCIENDERVADAASVQLSTIRRRMASCHQRIKEQMESIIRSAQYRDILMDSIITMRAGRYVVPVKQEYKNRLPGLVHDQSGSGATVFIEPMAAVNANNELRQLEADELEEVQRVLRTLSAALHPYVQQMQWTLEALTQLDFIFAKAALSRRLNAVPPVLNRQGRLVINADRHPMIDAKVVVPISLTLGGDFKTLLITGPNTGGKTVTLKTAGLFAMMCQAGLHLPAEEGTTLPIYDGVYADIGDEQSIEQSLSTFSSHMTSIVDILQQASSRSLVLLDELGAGTDPHEGAALAVAIIERLKSRGCCTLATTHYSELKAYALSTPDVENASMEFNVETLRPTYRLTMGIPGKSNAFEISKRLGLPEDVIENARRQMAQGVARFEDVLQSAEYHKEVARREREEAEALNREIQTLHGRIDAEKVRLEKQRQSVLDDARAQAQKLLDGARHQSEEVIRSLKDLKKIKGDSRDVDRGIQQARDAIRDAQRAMQEPREDEQRDAPTDLQAGETVVLRDSQLPATVLTPPDDRGNITVQAGIMKLNTNIANVSRGGGAQQKEARRAAREFVVRQIATELDIRGMNGEEGMMEVDRYLDEAFRAGRTEVSIIHGKGTGRLREIVHESLRHHPHVKKFRLGAFGEGEMGVTVVELK